MDAFITESQWMEIEATNSQFLESSQALMISPPSPVFVKPMDVESPIAVAAANTFVEVVLLEEPFFIPEAVFTSDMFNVVSEMLLAMVDACEAAADVSQIRAALPTTSAAASTTSAAAINTSSNDDDEDSMTEYGDDSETVDLRSEDSEDSDSITSESDDASGEDSEESSWSQYEDASNYRYLLNNPLLTSASQGTFSRPFDYGVRHMACTTYTCQAQLQFFHFQIQQMNKSIVQNQLSQLQTKIGHQGRSAGQHVGIALVDPCTPLPCRHCRQIMMTQLDFYILSWCMSFEYFVTLGFYVRVVCRHPNRLRRYFKLTIGHDAEGELKLFIDLLAFDPLAVLFWINHHVQRLARHTIEDVEKQKAKKRQRYFD